MQAHSAPADCGGRDVIDRSCGPLTQRAFDLHSGVTGGPRPLPAPVPARIEAVHSEPEFRCSRPRGVFNGAFNGPARLSSQLISLDFLRAALFQFVSFCVANNEVCIWVGGVKQHPYS